MFMPPSRPSEPGPVVLFVCGVGRPDRSEPEALPDVRGADARSRQIGGPDGISASLHRSA
jgi:hypothetical protein